MAGFSWLKPKTGIPPHTDKTPGKMTYHLGLNVPNGCALIANGKLLHHENGKILHFDSNQTHSAINGTDHDRMILYLLLQSNI